MDVGFRIDLKRETSASDVRYGEIVTKNNIAS